MADPITVTVRNWVGNLVGRAMVTDDNIRAIHARMLSMGLVWPAPDLTAKAAPCCDPGFFAPLPATPAPASPHVVDDEAMATWIVTFLKAGWPTGTPSLVRELVAAIRRGEVQGLPSPDAYAALQAEVERLQSAHVTTLSELNDVLDNERKLVAEVERLMGELEQEKELSMNLRTTSMSALKQTEAEVERLRAESKSGWDAYGKAVDDFELAKEQRDAAIARAEKAEAELAKSEQAHMELAKGELFQIRTANQERDAARAAHAEAVVLMKKLLDKWNEDNGSIFPFTVMVKLETHLAKHGDEK